MQNHKNSKALKLVATNDQLPESLPDCLTKTTPPRFKDTGLRVELDPEPGLYFQPQSGMAKTYGTTNPYLMDHFISTSECCFSNKIPLVEQLNRSAALLFEFQPQDALETMLIQTMIGTYNLTMECLRKAHTTCYTEVVDVNIKWINKLNRLFLDQLTALQKYRGKNSQEIKVEHVHVHNGGQAIVGTVNS